MVLLGFTQFLLVAVGDVALETAAEQEQVVLLGVGHQQTQLA
jgi:hypothetical protein